MQKRAAVKHHLFLTIAVSAAASVLLPVAVLSGVRVLGEALHLSAGDTDASTTIQSMNATSSASIIAPLTIHPSSSSFRSSKSSSRSSASSNEGKTNQSDAWCILSMRNCPATDTNCIAAPTFTTVQCEDSRCQLPGNACTRLSGGPTPSSASSVSSQSQSSRTWTSAPILQAFPSSPSSLEDNSMSAMMQTTTPVPAGTTVTDLSFSSPASLGCFTQDGQWTTDRAACATNQGRYFNGVVNVTASAAASFPTLETSGKPFLTNTDSTLPPVSGIPPSADIVHQEIQNDRQDAQLQARFAEDFRLQEQLNVATTDLLNTATNALQRLQVIPQQNLPPEAAASIAHTSDWLLTLISDLSVGRPTMEDVQSKAGALKGLLQDTMQTVATSLPVVVRKPDSLTSKMDRLMATIPTVFSFIQEQGLLVSPDALSEYQTSAALYTDIKPKCLRDADECLKLSDVISHLESMRAALEQSLDQAGKSDLKSDIDRMLQ